MLLVKNVLLFLNVMNYLIDLYNSYMQIFNTVILKVMLFVLRVYMDPPILTLQVVCCYCVHCTIL